MLLKNDQATRHIRSQNKSTMFCEKFFKRKMKCFIDTWDCLTSHDSCYVEAKPKNMTEYILISLDPSLASPISGIVSWLGTNPLIKC